MKIKLTKREKEALQHASTACYCESYYNYICTRCRNNYKIRSSHVKEFEILKSMGLIDINDKVSETGKILLSHEQI